MVVHELAFRSGGSGKKARMATRAGVNAVHHVHFTNELVLEQTGLSYIKYKEKKNEQI